MQQVINASRTAQRSFSIKEWMGEKSEAFSVFCGESVTNREVVMAHAAVVLLLVACSVAEWLGGGCHV
jgi:hypothetical protein